MKHIDDITDNSGAWARIDIIPGTDLDDPQLIMLTVKDEVLSAVRLTREQATALADALDEAVFQTF